MREMTEAEWQDFVDRKPGPMFYGVVTTGIYCRAGCPARLPLRRNVRWLDSPEDGRAGGLRACKRCKPDQPLPEARTLDCLGLLCPLPVLKARKVLLAMRPGQQLVVLTTDRMALIDLPHFCAEAGHVHECVSETDGEARHLITAGPSPVKTAR